MTQRLKVLAPHAVSLALEQVARDLKAAGAAATDFIFGPATGASALSITSRLAQGEVADMVLLPTGLMQEQLRAGRVQGESMTPVLRSGIGVCVRAGETVGDIGSVEGLKSMLLAASSVAYSAAGSGDYVSQELFSRLGIADAMRDKALRISAEPVGAVVARGAAHLGFQQLCELLPISGITITGPLPEAVQRYTEISAAVLAGSHQADAAQRFIDHLRFDAGGSLRRAGLEPIAQHHTGAAP